jgi:tetratricopeptide (TPR) repeat protein
MSVGTPAQYHEIDIPPAFRVFVHGRMRGITRARLARSVAQMGGAIAMKPSGADFVALAHSTAPRTLTAMALPASIPPDAELVSETSLKRKLKLWPTDEGAQRSLGADDLTRATKIDAERLRWLAAYDVLEPVDGRYSYADLLAAREVARLLSEGFRLVQIVEAALTLLQSGQRLSDTRLAQLTSGEIIQEYRGKLGRLDGQFTLPLGDEGSPGLEEVFAVAESCENEGRLAEAERWYAVAARIDRGDPVIPFNLGNVLDQQGRPDEAILAYHQALARDRTFPDAWFNLAAIAEDRNDPEQAAHYYREAVLAWPDHAEALFSLGRLLTDANRFDEAAGVWERYLSLRVGTAKHASLASRYAALCRLEVANAKAGS